MFPFVTLLLRDAVGRVGGGRGARVTAIGTWTLDAVRPNLALPLDS